MKVKRSTNQSNWKSTGGGYVQKWMSLDWYEDDDDVNVLYDFI